MNIILVSGKLAKARTLTLTIPHLVLGGAATLLALLFLAFGLQYSLLRYAGLNSPLLTTVVVSAHQEQNEKIENYLRDSLNAMASRLGAMQAQMLRLDTLGERLARTAGFKPQEFMFDQAPGRGGAVSTLPTYDLSLGDLSRQADLLTKQMDDRTEKLGILDSLMIFDSAKKKLLPSILPVEGDGLFSSNFGWRIDPFNGKRAFHEGIDFMAKFGVPARAAAGGVVIASEFHPQYGNMVEIDHGNGLTTRYAHLSKRDVKVGDVVLSRGRIGAVGNTGQSTGPHLHFEVRQNGTPLNPVRFLRLAS